MNNIDILLDRLTIDILDTIKKYVIYFPLVTTYSKLTVRNTLINKNNYLGYGIYSYIQNKNIKRNIYYINIVNKLPVLITEYIKMTNISNSKNILKTVKKRLPDAYIVAIVNKFHTSI